MINGIIYYKPFYEFKWTIGIPNVVDKQFSKKFMHRTIICKNKFINHLCLNLIRPFYKKTNAKYYNNERTFKCSDYELLKK